LFFWLLLLFQLLLFLIVLMPAGNAGDAAEHGAPNPMMVDIMAGDGACRAIFEASAGSGFNLRCRGDEAAT
jgi:hypothetical protein